MTNLASNLVATAARLPDKTGIKLDQAEVTWAQSTALPPRSPGSSARRGSRPGTESRSSCRTSRPTPSSSTARSSPAASWSR